MYTRRLLVVLAMTTLLFFNYSRVYSQNFQETIEYINDLLKIHSSQFGNTDPLYYYETIKVSERGQIKKIRMVADRATNKIESTGQIGYAYLKSIKVGEIEKKKPISDEEIYLFTLRSNESYDYSIIYSFSDGRSRSDNQMGFYINNFTVCKRLEKAFGHLLSLARDNDAFYERDPFDF